MMITLHKLNDETFILNAYHIETIESKPDTLITLTNDRKYIVKEAPAEVIEKVALEQENKTTMIQDGVFKVLEGITTMEEVFRVIS